MIMSHAPSLYEVARELRKQQTPAEKIMWTLLRGRNVGGYRFLRQKPLLFYIVDFYCAELKLIIEVDGSIHQEQEEADKIRTNRLEDMGMTVIRYTNDQVMYNLPFVLDDLKKRIASIASSPPCETGRG